MRIWLKSKKKMRKISNHLSIPVVCIQFILRNPLQEAERLADVQMDQNWTVQSINEEIPSPS